MVNTNVTLKSLLKDLIAAYPIVNVSSDTLIIYGKLLADIPIAALSEAVYEHIKSNRFFPNIAELRESAYEIQIQNSSIFNARIREKISLCPLCDENGFRYLTIGDRSGVVKCRHDSDVSEGLSIN